MSMFTRFLQGLSLATVSLTFSPHILAACEFSIVDVDVVGDSSYDVFTRDTKRQTINVVVEREPDSDSDMDDTAAVMEPATDGPAAEPADPMTADMDGAPMIDDPMPSPAAPCDLNILVESDGRFSMGADSLNFNLSSSQGNNRNSGSLIIRRENFAAGERQRYQVDITIPGEQPAVAGDYTASVAIGVASGSAADAEMAEVIGMLDDTTQASLALSVARVARVFISGTQSRQRVVDFGNMRTGGEPTLPVALLVQATDDVQLEFSSSNNGQLLNETHINDGAVDYTVVVRGERFVLDQPKRVLVPNPGDTGGEAVVALQFELGDVSRQRAGFYTDTLMITLRPSLDMP